MNKKNKKPSDASTPNRALALDALRGLAIVGMVLSGTIANTLPGWMYHAQVGPRSGFHFDESTPGITWVDLVFPFFLFAMGAAFPLAMAKKRESGVPPWTIILPLFKRALLLVFFAVSLFYVSPYRTGNYWTALLAFAGWFLSFARLPLLKTHVNEWVNRGGYILISTLVAYNVVSLPEVFTNGFKLSNNDIILLVLANMALFGGIIWLFTYRNWYARLGIMALFFGLRLSSTTDNSWNQWLFAFNPLSLLPQEWTTLLYTPEGWLYRMDFLKYLLIIIPGTIVGDQLLTWMRTTNHQSASPSSTRILLLLGTICLTLIGGNLWGWYSRSPQFTLLLNVVAGTAAWFLMRFRTGSLEKLFSTILPWALFWLLLGTALEAYEGGIRKDSATYSYFFITSGLACYTLLFFSIITDYFRRPWLRYLIESGQNPMVAYVAGTFVVVPILAIIGLLPWINNLTQYGDWFGLVKGIIITSGTVVVAVGCIRLKWFWKT